VPRAARSELDSKSRKNLTKYASQLDRMRAARRDLASKGAMDPRRLSQDEKLELYEALKDQKKERALSDFYFFAKYVLNYRDMAEMHRELCDFVTARDEEGQFYERSLILEPRGTFKSSVVTIGLPLWLLCHNPNLRILIDSEEYMKSRAFLAEAKAHMTSNEEFRRLFGEWDKRRFKGDVWTQTQINIAPRRSSEKETTISTAGVDVSKVGMHYDVIICDDLVSDKNSATRAQREKVIDHYKKMLSILEPNGMLIFIGTRWDFGDLYGHILEMDRDLEEKGKKPVWRKLIRSAVLPDGRLLFPERLSQGFLDAQRHEQGPYIYSCQYLNDPSGSEDALFKVRDWIQWCAELPPVEMKCAILVDPSVGRTDDSDMTAIVTNLVDPLNNWYVWDVQRGRWNPKEIIDNLVRARRKVVEELGIQPHVGMESVAFQRTLSFYARDLMLRREIERFSIIELKTDTRTTKEMRIKGIIPLAAQKKIHFVAPRLEVAPLGMKVLYEEMEQFPKGVTVDCLDALAYTPSLVTAPKANLPKPKGQGFWDRIIADRNFRGKYGKKTTTVGSRIRRGRYAA